MYLSLGQCTSAEATLANRSAKLMTRHSFGRGSGFRSNFFSCDNMTDGQNSDRSIDQSI